MIRLEGANLVEAERRRIEKQKSSRSSSRNAERQREWARQKEKQLREVLKSEQIVQQQVLRMQRVVLEAEPSEDGSVKSSKSLLEVQSRIEQLGDEILKEQRASFQQLRDEAMGLGDGNLDRRTYEGDNDYDDDDDDDELGMDIRQGATRLGVTNLSSGNKTYVLVHLRFRS